MKKTRGAIRVRDCRRAIDTTRVYVAEAKRQTAKLRFETRRYLSNVRPDVETIRGDI